MSKLILIFVSLLSGTYSGRTDYRIIGGRIAEEGQFPYQVSIRHNSTGDHHCGGSIIDSKWILTAAHCLKVVGEPYSPSDFYIFAGEVSLNDIGVTRRLSKIITHPKYTTHPPYDIGLLELEEEIEFSNTIHGVKLETEEDVGAVNCVASGWGMVSELSNPEWPDELQYIRLGTLTSKQCQMKGAKGFSPDIEVCTFSRNGGVLGIGDSGGPLVATNNKQIGVISWGRNVAEGKFCGYTKVSAFIDWIEDTTNKTFSM